MCYMSGGVRESEFVSGRCDFFQFQIATLLRFFRQKEAAKDLRCSRCVEVIISILIEKNLFW